MPEKNEQEAGKVVQPETITFAELEQLTGDDAQKIIAEYKRAKQANADRDKIERLLEAVVESQKNVNDIIGKEVADRTKERDAAEFEALIESKMVEKFKALPKESTERREIFEALSKEYGVTKAELALKGSELRKSIEAPIHKEVTEDYELKDRAQKAWDYVYLLAATMGGVEPGPMTDKVDINPRIMAAAAERLEKQGLVGAGLIKKGINEAMDTQTATEGLEWIPTNLSANMVDAVYLSLKVAALFPHIEMTSKTFEFPIRTARALGYRMAEATANNQFFTNLATAHSMETGKLSFTAQKLATLNFISDELEQDAILPILSMMREDVIFGLNQAIEDATINGDTAATLDGALWSGTADARGAWSGIRKSINAAEKTDLSTFSLTTLRNMRKPMDKYSVTVEDLVYVVSPKTHIELLKLAEVVTLEKYGPMATVLNGEIGKIDGIPIIVSPYIYSNLNASGVYDGTTTTKTMMLLINKRGFAFGDRRTVRVESDRQALAGQRYVLATGRWDFRKIFPAAEALVALGYNVTP